MIFFANVAHLNFSYRHSAVLLVKVVAVRKTRTALQEDIIGLNIALEAKQQEIAFVRGS